MQLSDFTADHELDARGLNCPEPVMLLHRQVREAKIGETLHVRATDPSTTRDIPKFCTFLGHDLLKQQSDDKEYHYLIRKQGN
jgi:tRNA 2-thiouridine synthesizing protein A